MAGTFTYYSELKQDENAYGNTYDIVVQANGKENGQKSGNMCNTAMLQKYLVEEIVTEHQEEFRQKEMKEAEAQCEIINFEEQESIVKQHK